MASAFLKFSAIILFLSYAAASVVDHPINDFCLGCICQAISGCEYDLQCDGDACGLLRITRAYWADAGKPTIDGFYPDEPGAYPSCITDAGCAATTVQLYINRFAQDCNGDGKIDCYDYAAIHKLGGYGCKEELPGKFNNTFMQCMNQD